MTNRHPELAGEQQYLDRAHDAHEATIAGHRDIVAGKKNAGANPAAQRVIRERSINELERLRDVDTSRLIFGRLDFAEGKTKTVYVGPCTVMADGKVQVVDFTRDIAKPFFKADEQDPMGLDRRRTFDLHERELRDISDELFGEEEVPRGRRTVLDRVAEELERAREPHMQSIVATIVADQYRLIEAPAEGVFIVQGGPGTGKTAVALHRAVYLLRNNEELGKVLVVGPNAAFMAYIANVVPGLGETTVDQVPIGRLPETGEAQARGRDPVALASLKGDSRMAMVIANALRQRVRPASEPFALSSQGVVVRLEVEQANAVLEREVGRERQYMEGRRRFVDAMRAEIEGLLQVRFARSLRRRTVDSGDLQRQLATDRIWTNWLERMWPTMSAPQLIHELFTIEQRLRQAGEGLLTDAEVSNLLRRGVRTVGVHPWTGDDLPLIDEAQALIQGIKSEYGYVIVDEAQDLTPMQLRVIARRSRIGDMTLVGDVAQATGPTRYRDWDEIAAHLPRDRGVRRDQLTVGYRVPRSIMDLANSVLPMVAPDLPITEPVREARVDPEFRRVAEFELSDAVAATVSELATDGRSVGVITPENHLVSVRGGLAARGVPVGDISTDQLEKRVTLLASADAKGLEFDRVVLVEPWEIVTGGPAGWSELYVALSRATQQLVVVHSGPLPAPLPGGEPVSPPAMEELVADRAEGGHEAGDEDAPLEAAADVTLDLELDLELPDTPTPAGSGTVPIDEPPVPAPEGREDEVPVEAVPVIVEVDDAGRSADQEDDGGTVPTEASEETGTDAATTELPGPSPTSVPLGGAFSEAIVYTKLLHDGRTRRGTAVPYLSHLLATAALVLEDGGNETEAIAALLHDAVEDGVAGTADTIRARFGSAVADIVIGCTDPKVDGGFRATKQEHFEILERGSTSMRRVALAEKLDNASALLRDLERYGDDTWTRMEVEREEMHWYLRNLVALFDRTFPSVLADELRRVVEQIEARAS